MLIFWEGTVQASLGLLFFSAKTRGYPNQGANFTLILVTFGLETRSGLTYGRRERVTYPALGDNSTAKKIAFIRAKRRHVDIWHSSEEDIDMSIYVYSLQVKGFCF